MFLNRDGGDSFCNKSLDFGTLVTPRQLKFNLNERWFSEIVGLGAGFGLRFGLSQFRDLDLALRRLSNGGLAQNA